MRPASISEIRKLASVADEKELKALRRSLAGDARLGISPILDAAQRRIDKQKAEASRLSGMYSFERSFCASDAEVCIGLDEVGRGPIAGPVAVGAVVLPLEPLIEGLNDSKKVPEGKRSRIAQDIKDQALGHAVVFVEACDIDKHGITACLKKAFSDAVSLVEKNVGAIDHVLLDGNPMRIDEREINIVKGDSKCASIAAASMIAKVERDKLMCAFDEEYPGYGFAENKGYGTKAHMEAIRKHGLCEIHRRSFCSGIVQETLF